MPRQARIVILGELFHVTQRGNYRQNIFNEDNDKIQYLKYFEKYSQQYGLELFAFCLMDNHVHFIVRPLNLDSMAKTICRAHQRYSVFYHAKHAITGHLWQERYFSCLLQRDHVKRAIRYVECNPVRANMVCLPWQYSFSSARAHLGKKYNLITLADISEIIEVSSWKAYLSNKEDSRIIEQIRSATKKGLIFGSEEYIKEIQKRIGRKIIKTMGRPKK